jgi:hypothetical protein
MSTHKDCSRRQIVVAEAAAENTVLDYMADELSASASVEYRPVAVDIDLAATEIGFEQNVAGCKEPAAEGETERRPGTVGTGVDILTMPSLQKYFGLATEDYTCWLLDYL